MRPRSPLCLVLLVLVTGCGGDDAGTEPPQDSVPPARVSDLAASVENESTAVLTWTAPGDDDALGTATQYDLRWSNHVLTDQTWVTGIVCPSPPSPARAGSHETYRATGLPPDSALVFLVRTVDEADNWSPVSNAVPLTLPTPTPICSLSVQSLDFGSVAPHASADHTFAVINVGGGVLSGFVESAGGSFMVVEGGGGFELGSQESRSVTVRFAPDISGPASGRVELGTESCGAVECIGQGSGPFCVVDVDTLQFGSVYVDEFATRRVQVANHGDHFVAIAPRLEGCLGFRFPYDEPFVLQPGESRFLTLRFEPYADGPVSCSLELNAGGECDRVVLLAEGVGPECWMSADGRVFGPIAVGEAVEWPFTMENRGGGVIEGTIAASCPDFTIVAGAGSYAFRHGEGRIVRVRFAPQSAGEKTCVIETGSDLCRDVSLRGIGLGSICRVEPDTLDFGTVPIATTTERTFTITNDGVSTLTGSIPVQCGDFAMSEGWGGFSLGPNETKSCRVRFQPLAPGPAVCTLSLGPSCEALLLRGSATGEFCRVEPAGLDFGIVPIRSDSIAHVTVMNVGPGAPLQLSVRNLACSGFSIVEGGGAVWLDAGEEHVVTVRFAPERSGPQECTLDLGAPSCPSVSLRGVGLAVVCELTPSVIDFGELAIGTSAETTLTVRNLGGGILLAQPRLDCPDFTIPFSGTFGLEHGQARNLTVKWRPTTIGPARCAVWIGTTCDSVPLSGVCFDPPPVCSISEDSLSFGLATVGRLGAERSFTIRNDGGQIVRGFVSESSADFEIISGGGAFELYAHGSQLVTIRFTPTEVGMHTAMVDLGTVDCSNVTCTGAGVSYRIRVQMDQIDDVARLSINEDGPTYTAKFGWTGTDRTGWRPIGHLPGDSGGVDITADLAVGENRLRFTLENTVCCDATVRVRVWKDGATLFSDEFADHTNPPRGILYDEAFVFDTAVE